METFLSILKIAAFLFLAGCIILLIVSLFYAVIPRAFVKIRQGQAGIIERGGKFARVAAPGINPLIPWLEEVVGVVNCEQIQTHEQSFAVKTRENANIQIPVVVRYRGLVGRARIAFYETADIGAQIDYYSSRVLKSCASSYVLDAIFAAPPELEVAISNELDNELPRLGYEFLDAHVSNISAAQEVESIINKSAAQPFERTLAAGRMEIDRFVELARVRNQAEAHLILEEALQIARLKAAEITAKVLQFEGQGIAAQQRAIADGFTQFVEQFQKFQDPQVRNTLVELLRDYFRNEVMKGLGSRANMFITSRWPSGE